MHDEGPYDWPMVIEALNAPLMGGSLRRSAVGRLMVFGPIRDIVRVSLHESVWDLNARSLSKLLFAKFVYNSKRRRRNTNHEGDESPRVGRKSGRARRVPPIQRRSTAFSSPTFTPTSSAHRDALDGPRTIGGQG